MAADPLVASLGDASLRRSEAETLREGQWINDGVIAFALALLETRAARVPTRCLPPSVAALAAHLPSAADAAAVVGLDWERSQTERLIVPVSDNEDASRALGGSHWTLLVWDCERWHHFDSARRSSSVPSRVTELARKLVPTQHPVVAAETPQQENGYDCGVFVMLAAAAVYDSTCPVGDAVTPARVNTDAARRMRQALLERIYAG